MEATTSTKQYRLRHGMRHYDTASGQLLEGGAIVELTEDQAKAFHDKVVPADQPLPPAPMGDTEEDTDDDEGEEDDDEDESDDDQGSEEGPASGELPAGDPDESPIARRRREKSERKAQRKKARDDKNKK